MRERCSFQLAVPFSLKWRCRLSLKWRRCLTTFVRSLPEVLNFSFCLRRPWSARFGGQLLSSCRRKFSCKLFSLLYMRRRLAGRSGTGRWQVYLVRHKNNSVRTWGLFFVSAFSFSIGGYRFPKCRVRLAILFSVFAVSSVHEQPQP